MPPETAPPAPTGGLLGTGANGVGSVDKNASFKAHRDAFFFLLQRELEKVRVG